MRSLCLTMMTGIVFASVSLFMDACRKPEECKCLKSNGKQVEQHRSLNSFNKIVLRDNVNLTILQDTINDMVLNVPENLANFVKTEVKDSVLNISNDNRCNWLRSFNIEINAFVRTNNLKNIECHGSGNIRSESFIEKDNFEVNVFDGSGRIDLMLKTKVAKIKLHVGPADIHINGYTDSSLVYNAGTGFIFMQNFDSKTTDIRHAGTGQCYVKATENLYATLEYIGDINYWGNPVHEYLYDKGKGQIIKH